MTPAEHSFCFVLFCFSPFPTACRRRHPPAVPVVFNRAEAVRHRPAHGPAQHVRLELHHLRAQAVSHLRLLPLSLPPRLQPHPVVDVLQVGAVPSRHRQRPGERQEVHAARGRRRTRGVWRCLCSVFFVPICHHLPPSMPSLWFQPSRPPLFCGFFSPPRIKATGLKNIIEFVQEPGETCFVRREAVLSV